MTKNPSIPEYFQYVIDDRNALEEIGRVIKWKIEGLGSISPSEAKNSLNQYLASEMAKSVATMVTAATNASQLLIDENRLKEFETILGQPDIADNVKSEMLASVGEIVRLNLQIADDVAKFQQKLFHLYDDSR